VGVKYGKGGKGGGEIGHKGVGGNGRKGVEEMASTGELKERDDGGWGSWFTLVAICGALAKKINSFFCQTRCIHKYIISKSIQ
jgi:hypothetical protein